MTLFQFIIALVVLNYLYKIINGNQLNEEEIKKIFFNKFKKALTDINKEYKEWNDQFLTSVIDANGDINKIVDASKVIDNKIKEKDIEIMELDFNKFNKQKKSK